MRNVKIVKWIILNYEKQPPEFICQHCGEGRIAHIPAVMSDFIKQGEAFSASHRFCQVMVANKKEGIAT